MQTQKPLSGSSFPQLNVQFDEDIFDIIQPPQQYPPTLEYLVQENDAYFVKQCHNFLSNQKDTYFLSKKIETNLGKLLNSSKEMQSLSSKKDLNNDKIVKELKKLNESKSQLEKRSSALEMICEMIKLEKLKGMLLLQSDKPQHQQLVLKTKPKGEGSQKTIPKDQTTSKKPISQQQKRTYLHNLSKVFSVVKESKLLQDLISQNSFPLIESILTQLHELFSSAIDRALSPELLTPDMIALILQEFYEPFLYEENLFIKTKKSPRVRFVEAMVNNRVQKYRLELNPIINNLNYANNVIDLYDSILVAWVRIIDEDLKLFSKSNETSIVKTATKIILNEAMPKLEKNTYKMKEMSPICFIRFKLHQFLDKLNSIELLQQKQPSKKQLPQAQQKWQPLPSMIQKMKIFLQAKIQQESQKLSTTKYNIYSLTSYLPVREYLETIKECIEYDFERPPDLQFAQEESLDGKDKSPRSPSNNKKNSSTNTKYLDWQKPFYNLTQGRKPQSQPNNKSLVIFNLNVWYLYLKIIKQPSYKILAVETMLWCKQKFIQMNIKQCLKVYYESLDKILQMCGNLPVFRNTLYAQINMLGHEDLRVQVAKGIKQNFLVKYKEMLVKIGKERMNNEEVKAFCKENKINLNKFGKYSNQICIYSAEELSHLIDYT